MKYGLIKDSEFFVWQEECVEKMAARDAEVLAEAVERSCVNKALVSTFNKENCQATRYAQQNINAVQLEHYLQS